MSINKKHIITASMLSTAIVMPMANITNSYANETRTTTANVNFRTGPGTKYSSMTVIPKGKKVTYLGKSGGWIKAKYNSKTGYISDDYLTSGSSSSTSTSIKYVNTSAGLNVRKGPSTSYAKVGKLSKGTKVTVISTSKGWSKITSGSIRGYVSNDYLSSKKPSTSNSNNSSSTSTTTKYVNTSSGLNVRKGPSTSYAKVGKLSKGTKVTVSSTSNGWSKITSGNIKGYVSSEYLSSKKPSTSNDKPSNSTTSKKASTVINYAKKQLGKPYVWGAQGPSSFDCSGFTYYTFKKSVGITLPRTSSAQSKYGKYVSKSNLKPGDLVFFDTVGSNNGVVTHCGIYIGSGQFIHSASGQGKVVINNINSSYYVKAWVNARRVL